jgi:ATP-binding cassette, subfamily F, member 3
MLSIQLLRVEYGARVLFNDLSFTVQPRERIAFAGHNGAGKSTLMKCIAGIIQPTSGKITAPRGFRIGYLPQEGIHVKNITLWDETESAFAEAVELKRKIDELSDSLEHLDPRSSPFSECLEEIGNLELQLEAFDPARMKPRIQSVLMGLGFSEADFSRDCGHFSGGWQMRIAMAKLFLQAPEVLLLDEPTNHLDIDSQAWMENYLINYPGAILLISHDRSLLDTLCTRTIAFHKGRAEEYAGNYSYYEKESVARKENLKRQYEAQRKEIAKSQEFIDRFRASANKATLVQSRIKLLAKVERIVIEAEDPVVNFRFPKPPNSGHTVALLEKSSKKYGDHTVFENFDFEIIKGEKFAVVGPNGAGKSTFCRLITGEEAPTDGTFTLGLRVSVSYFSQNHADELDPTKTVLETVEESATREAAPHCRNLLGCFLFRGDDVFKKIGVLSGGERSRVALVRMLVQPANFLILDEPTNHLDMQSQDVLQRALIDYPGTVLIVSHNRNFLDPLVSKTIEFRPGAKPTLYPGNISYYLEKSAADRALAEKNKVQAKTQKSFTPIAPILSKLAPVPEPIANNANRKDQRKQEAEIRNLRNKQLKPLQDELESVEGKIAAMEADQTKLTTHLSSEQVAADAQLFRETSNSLEKLTHQLELAYSRWSELTAQIEIVEANFPLPAAE